MERKIGEIFEYNGEWYQCVPNKECNECAFHGDEDKCCMTECSIIDRSDSTSVVFMKLEKVGEPYEFDGHLFQSYRTFEVPIFTENYATVRELGNNSKISIEIKQNQEDMEENYKAEDTPLTRLVGKYVNNLIDYETFEKAVKELYFDKEKSKLTLKEFDFEAAKQGKPVCTRDGRKARIICFDSKNDPKRPIVALVENNGNELLYEYTIEGKERFSHISTTGTSDLMMLPEKKEGWAVIRKGDIYETEELARKELLDSRTAMMIKKISWEE